MKTILYPALALILLVGSAASYVASAPGYKIKDSYSIEFKSKDPSGEFTKMSGTIKFDEDDLSGSKFDLSFDVSSISTGNGMKNKKAQTAEWFNAAKYPQITFVSTKIEKASSGTTFANEYNVYGNLKMKGITKEKKVSMKVSKNGKDITFSGSLSVNRMDFKVGKTSDVVPNIMNVTYSIPATQN
jgi:polyisoprenoid-binding protein YceI